MSYNQAEPLFLEQLKDMGFPEARARKAVLRTHNTGVEPAVNWLVEHHNDADIDVPVEPLSPTARGESSSAAALGSPASGPVLGVPSDVPLVVHPDGQVTQTAMVVGGDSECKVVLVVVRELNMSAGKVGAQCAHAAVGLYQHMVQNRVPWLNAWHASGEKTVVLGIDAASKMEELADQATELSLPTHAVYDAGRTEVPSGSLTVLAIGGVSESVDKVTGHLKTL